MRAAIGRMRVDIPGGMWAPKVSGEFQEGDPVTTAFFVEGKVEIKELAGHLKLFFTDVKLVKRKLFLTNKEKEDITKKYMAESAEQDKKSLEEGKEPLEDAARAERDEAAIAERHKSAEAAKVAPVPSRLYVYLTRRKPKTRMNDAHTNGSKIHLTQHLEGLFGKEETLGTFAVSLKDIPDALGYLGLVVLKLPADAPKTNEPVIYGLVKLQSARSVKIKTSSALHLTEISESLFKVLSELDSAGATKGGARSAEDSIKPLHYYHSLATRAWASMQKAPDEEVEIDVLARMLDKMNIFLVDAQVKRLFKAVDVDGSGEMGMSEFENFVMGYDILGAAGADLAALDVYETLKCYPDDCTKVCS